jgi:polysaccharide chain length determinant protein (PEP-CTERM system associated)
MDALESLVKSRAQLERLVTEFDLYQEERRRMPLEDVIDRMRDVILVELVRPGRNMPPDSFHVRFSYGDPVVAARVTTRLGGIFVDQNARDRGDLADATSAFLTAQLADSKSRLEAHEKKMAAFRERNAGTLPTQAEFNLQAMQNVQTQLRSVTESIANDRERKLLLERLYNEGMAQPPIVTPVAASANPAEGQAAPGLTLRQQVEAANAAVARLELRLKPQHPDLRRARAVAMDLQKRLEAEPPAATQPAAAPVAANPAELQRRERLAQMKAEVESLDRQIVAKQREEQALTAELADYRRRIEAVPSTESEWVSLTRDYETLTTAYKNLLQKSEDSRVAADLERRQIGEQFRVLEPARVPARPVGPARLKVNGIGLGLGLFLGLLVVAVLELRDRTFRSETDITDVLALPVLALVPLVETTRERAVHVRRRRLLSTAVAATVLCAGIVFWRLQLWKHVM